MSQKNIIRLSESQLKKVITESVQTILNEFIAGGNDWGRSYSEYIRMHTTNVDLDDIVRELHTICQYYEEFYDVASGKYQSRLFPQLSPEKAKDLTRLIAPIYGLFANRNNRKNDRQGMTLQEIQMTCMESLQTLSQDRSLGIIYNAACRALNMLNAGQQ